MEPADLIWEQQYRGKRRSRRAEFGSLFVWFVYSFQRDGLALFGDTQSQSLEKHSACQAISVNLQLINTAVEPYLNIVNTLVALQINSDLVILCHIISIKVTIVFVLF